jgi:hypothetical protein
MEASRSVNIPMTRLRLLMKHLDPLQISCAGVLWRMNATITQNRLLRLCHLPTSLMKSGRAIFVSISRATAPVMNGGLTLVYGTSRGRSRASRPLVYFRRCGHHVSNFIAGDYSRRMSLSDICCERGVVSTYCACFELYLRKCFQER